MRQAVVLRSSTYIHHRNPPHARMAIEATGTQQLLRTCYRECVRHLSLVTFRSDLHHPVQTYQPLHLMFRHRWPAVLFICVSHVVFKHSCIIGNAVTISYLAFHTPAWPGWQLKTLVLFTLNVVGVKEVARGDEEISGREAQVDNNNNNNSHQYHEFHGASQGFLSKCALPQV